MKIEIELREVEALRMSNNELWQENAKMRNKLESLSEEELTSKAAKLARTLFGQYLEMVFQKLGFSERVARQHYGLLIDHSELEKFLGTAWHEHPDRLFVQLGVTMTEEWKVAFMKIGVSEYFLEQGEEKKDLKL